MADEIKPTLDEEPEGESSGAKEQQQEIDVDAIMKELQAIGKTKPEDVRGMHQASVQTGRYANEIGQLRQQIQQLQQERQAPRRGNYEDYDSNEPIDLGQVIESKLESFWTKKQQEQYYAYQQQLEEQNQIRNDEDYELVRDVWEQHMQNPQTQVRVQTGQSSLSKEYDKVVRAYLRGVAKKSREALEYVNKRGGKKPPHIEQGQNPPPVREADDDDPKTKARKVAANSKGSDDDLDAMIDAMLPKGDPIFRT